MAHPIRHAESSVRKFGGKAEDYLAVHSWFDESKAFFPDFRHRALRHHAAGIFLAERVFGVSIINSQGKAVPVRYLGEQHVREDLGRIPTLQDWLVNLKPAPWMYGRKLELESEVGQPLSGQSDGGHNEKGRTAEENQQKSDWVLLSPTLLWADNPLWHVTLIAAGVRLWLQKLC